MRQSSRFTLIELLVVVSIIAVLASLLLPMLAQARGTARLTDCTNRIRQMGVAVTQYYDENDSWWPGQYINAAGAMDYRSAAARYLGIYEQELGFKFWKSGRKLANPLMCPGSYSLRESSVTFYVSAANGSYFDAIGAVAQPQIVTGYTCNPFFGSTDTSPQRARRGDPPDPSLTLMLADGYREVRPNYWYVSAGKSFFRFRHQESFLSANDGKLNMTYLDGHVVSYKWTAGGPIYPRSGNGLWTSQPGFLWWASTWGASR
jgi:prepilin-type N-terminal cleavage/methylation domain-containing protein/prepilin-type processing-associated H-X9-DG protein